MKFIKKPVEIEAWKVTDLCKWAATDWGKLPPTVRGAYERGEIIFLDSNRMEIKTLEGWVSADENYWIIQGVKTELYPRRWDIFEQTYDAINSEETKP